MNNTIEQEIEKLENEYIRVLQQQQFVAPHILEGVIAEYRTLGKKKQLPDFLQEKNIINITQHRFIVKKMRDIVKNEQNGNTPVKKKSYKSYGPYRILERVASGAMGVIYKAEDTRNGDIVALKIIRDGADAKKMRKQRFDREARSAQKVQSPGVVSIKDAGEINGIPYLAMDFVEGSTLDEYWEELVHKDINEAVRIGVAIARALAHTHKAGIIHRDIKPANILMDCTAKPPIPMITDFSLAMITDPLEQKLTQTGVAVGTPYYMSPEQTLGIREDIGPHTDTYSLGAVLYEMLCGSPPFKAKSIRELYSKIQKQPPFSLAKKNEEITPVLEKIIFKALEKKPSQRYKSCDDFADAMDKYLNNEPVELDRPSLHSQIQAFIAKHYRNLRIGALATMVFIISVLLMMLLFPKSDNNTGIVTDNSKNQVENIEEFETRISQAVKDIHAEALDERESQNYYDLAMRNVNSALKVYSPELVVESLLWQASEDWQKGDAKDFWLQVSKWQELPIKDFLISISKSHPQDYFAMSFSLMHVGYISKALSFIERYEKKDTLAEIFYGRLLWLTGADTKKAYSVLNKIDSNVLKDTNIQFPLVLLAQNQIVEAHTLAHQLIKKYPNNPLWQLTLGIIYREIGQLELAKDIFNRIYMPQEMKNAALYHKGLCYKKQARYQNAIECFESILVHTPVHPNAFYELLVCSKEAKQDIQNYFGLYALRNLIAISNNLNYEQAAFAYESFQDNLGENYFSDMLRGENETSEFYYLKALMTLSRMDASRKDLQMEALGLLEKALEIAPADFRVAFKTAQIYEKLKKNAQALNLYSHAFWCAPDWKEREKIYNTWMELAFKEDKFWHLGDFIDLFEDDVMSAETAQNFRENWLDLCYNAENELERLPKTKFRELQKRAVQFFLKKISSRELVNIIDEIPEEKDEIALVKSLLFYMAKDYDRALKTINLANPNDSNTHFLRARILVAMENATINPYEYYEKAYERNNSYQQRTSYLISVNNYAEKLEDKTQYKEAISMLEKTLQNNQNNALNEKSKGYLLLSRLYLLQGDVVNAKKNCEYALQENKTVSGPYLMLADIFEYEGNFEKAIAYCRFASSQAHNNKDANVNIEQKIEELEQKLNRSNF